MPRIATPLTDTKIKQSKVRDKEYNLADGGGLFLRIKPSGSKQWLFNYYKPFVKRRTNISFGDYPSVSLAEARKRRAEARELLAQDIDPKKHQLELEAKSKEQLENTLQSQAEEWRKLKEQNIKQSTLTKLWIPLNKHILPQLGKLPVNELTPMNVMAVLEVVIDDGKLETAKRLTRTLNEIMDLAAVKGIIDINPLARLTKLVPSPKSKKMATLKPEELHSLMDSISNANIAKPTRCLLEWQLHTMTRPTEAVTARWEDIDLDKRVWTIPASQMKMGREHTIPLSNRVLELLAEIRSFSEKREYLFPGYNNPRSHMNSSTANMALKRMGFKGKLVAHGMRALASTTLNEHGFNPDVIESALAHQDSNAIRAAYNRAEYLAQRKEMMEWWSDHINNASQKTKIS